MTISITHAFVSGKTDGTDATLVQPSNWNAGLSTSMATNKILGRMTAGTGVFEELSVTGSGNVVMSASPTFTGTAAHAAGSFSGAVSITDATVSNATNAGALIVNGGVGIGGALNVGSAISGASFASVNGATVGILAYTASCTYFGNDKILALGPNTSTTPSFAINVGSSNLSLAYNVITFSATATTTQLPFRSSSLDNNFGATSPWSPAPLCAEIGSSGNWPVAIKGVDRGIIYLVTGTSNLYAYFTQNTTGNAVGSIAGTASATVFNTASDERLKKNFDMDGIDWGARIDALWVGAYQSINDTDGQWRMGVRAQQAYGIVPQGVMRPKNPDEMYMVDYSLALAPLAMWGVKDLRNRFTKHEDEIAALKTRVVELEQRLAA